MPGLSTCGAGAQYLQFRGSVLVAPGVSTCGSGAQYLRLWGLVLVALGLSTCGSGAQYLRLVGSVLAAPGLSTCGWWALERRLSSCAARASSPRGTRGLPGLGMDAASPALASVLFAAREGPPCMVALISVCGIMYF